MERRKQKEEVFLNMAEEGAWLSTCCRAIVCAIITDANDRIISTGYNGSLPGAPHCMDVGCLMVNGHCVRTVHGEANACLFCNQDMTRGTIYIFFGGIAYDPPMTTNEAGETIGNWICKDCNGKIFASGIRRVVTKERRITAREFKKHSRTFCKACREHLDPQVVSEYLQTF